MKNLKIIAAIGERYELGKNNQLIWKIPDDLKFFKKQTMSKNIIMGYNTFISLPKILPGRTNIILTHRNIEEQELLKIFHDKESLLKYIDNQETYVIGGSSVYEQFINDVDEMCLTEIKMIDKNADTYFPKINIDEWKREIIEEHLDSEIPYIHTLYKKIKR